MTINNEAVEVAVRAIVASLPNDAELETHRPWATGYARASLEAAAQIIRAEALREAADALTDASSLNTSGAISNWLRARAAAVRGEDAHD